MNLRDGKIISPHMLWILVSFLIVAFISSRGIYTSPTRPDAQVFYVAAQALDRGMSPYDLVHWVELWSEVMRVSPEGLSERIATSGWFFSYIPTFLPLLYLASPLSWDEFKLAVDVFNVSMLVAIVVGLRQLIDRFSEGQSEWHRILALLVACSPAAAIHVFLFGQTSLLVMAALVWMLILGLEQRRVVWFSLCVLVASIKPQMTLLPTAMVMLLVASRRQVLASLFTLLLVIAGVFAWMGLELISDFMSVLDAYKSMPVNKAAYMTGLIAIGEGQGLRIPLPVSIVASVLAFTAFVRLLGLKFVWSGAHGVVHAHGSVKTWFHLVDLKRGIPADSRSMKFAQITALVWLLTEVFIPLHYCDHVLLMLPLMLCLLGRHPKDWLIFLPLIVAIRPNILSPIGVGPLQQNTATTLSVCYLVLFLIVDSWQKSRQ